MSVTRRSRIEHLLADLQRRNRPPVPLVLYARADGGFIAEGIKYDTLSAFIARHGEPPLVIMSDACLIASRKTTGNPEIGACTSPSTSPSC